MDASTICITFIITIFGIAYPILFQAVTRLDEKYSSTLIIDLFKSEKGWRLFQYSLIISLISIIIWIFRLPTATIEIKWVAFLIENSAILILLLSTTVLVVSFFIFVNKINTYYAPLKFIKYLIDQTKKEPQNLESSYFKAICDILYYSIKEQNETISRTISDPIYKVFQQYRDSKPNEPIEYPFSYYELVKKSTQELAILSDKKLEFLITRTVGGIWLLGELRDYQISEKTYIWLWSNLLIAIKYERDDMLLSYWGNAHQYASINLRYIHPRFSSTDRSVINQEEVEKRKNDRTRFLEFHYALGGLLLYRQNYNCIKRIFKYTTDLPPIYVLLPTSMNEIFNIFFQFLDPNEDKFTWISSQYYFPDIEGIEADGTVKHWICQYIALLFFRQYSIVPYLITIKPLDLPDIPKSQYERYMWMDHLDYFKKLVENHHNNQDLKSKTGLSFLTDQWCINNQKPTPLELMDQIKIKVSEAFETTQVIQEISEIKQVQFQTSTVSILKNTFQKYGPINNSAIIESNFNNWFISGDRAVIDKSAFAENQEADNMNFDSFLAESISDKFARGISETFFHTRSNSYFIKPEMLFQAIDKLKIIGNDFIMVCFGLNIAYYKEYFKVTDLEETKYKNLQIINFTNYNYHIIGESVFILKKSDLPHIEFITIDSAQIEKYSLIQIDEDYKIYSSVIPLNTNDGLREELQKSKSDDELQKSVLVSISFKTEIRWRKDIKNVMMQTSSPFREKGLTNDLKDIKEFE
jgi:hypothetical protein